MRAEPPGQIVREIGSAGRGGAPLSHATDSGLVRESRLEPPHLALRRVEHAAGSHPRASHERQRPSPVFSSRAIPAS